MSEKRETRRKAVFPMHRLKLESPREDGRRRIEGYAAVFGNRDSFGDIILPGAFARTLKERPDIKVLWQHDVSQPIGAQETGYEDEFGLAVTGKLSNTDKVKGEVVPLLEDGVVTGLSIGYDVRVEEFNEDAKAYFLKDLDLFEWSPVTFPANELAQVQEVKDLGDRTDGHAARVQRHAKALQHELTGYFGDGVDSDRLARLDLPLLSQVHGVIAGRLPDTGAAEAADASSELAYIKGWNDALDHIEKERDS